MPVYLSTSSFSFSFIATQYHILLRSSHPSPLRRTDTRTSLHHNPYIEQQNQIEITETSTMHFSTTHYTTVFLLCSVLSISSVLAADGTITFCNEPNYQGNCTPPLVFDWNKCFHIPDSNAKGDKGSSYKVRFIFRYSLFFPSFFFFPFLEVKRMSSSSLFSCYSVRSSPTLHNRSYGG